jgi:ARC6-like, IMS domain
VNAAAMPTAERVSQTAGGRTNGTVTNGNGRTVQSAGDRRNPTSSGFRVPDVSAVPVRRSPQRGAAPRLDRIVFMLAMGVIGVGLLGFLATRTYGWLSQMMAPGAALQGEQLQIQIDRPPIPIPDPTAVGGVSDPNAPLTAESALQVVEQWLSIKAAALGQEHASERLSEILIDPALGQQQQRAEEAKRDNWYWKYEHQAEITGFEVSENDPNQAQIEATVSETAELYENNQLNVASSYDEQLQVRYDLVRQEGEWRIKSMTVQP